MGMFQRQAAKWRAVCMSEALGKIDDQTIKHLELIQAVISRLAQNSFTIKSIAITLVVAALAFIGSSKGNSTHLLMALVPTITFWGLDAHYLRQERLFRRLYEGIRSAGSGMMASFSMDVSPYRAEVDGWWATCWSPTIKWFYGPISLVIVGIVIALDF